MITQKGNRRIFLGGSEGPALPFATSTFEIRERMWGASPEAHCFETIGIVL